jgi:hypothetical protein
VRRADDAFRHVIVVFENEAVGLELRPGVEANEERAVWRPGNFSEHPLTPQSRNSESA